MKENEMKRMNERTAFNVYLKTHPVNYPGNIDTLIETLYWWHTQYNPVENEELKEIFAGVEAWIHELARDKKEEKAYMNIVSTVCSEYERVAYMEGIKVGMRLVMEAVE